ncbi:hypothetical protein BGZ73_005822 [Actinomortierella ambigua]|nr:hypothetical protein BGZ73_005822 [Actinomortierella ambigua]
MFANLRLKHGHVMAANCRRPSDSDDPTTWPESSIDLNEIIGNSNGTFVWGGEHFVLRADNPELHSQGNQMILTADLLTAETKWNHKVQLNLSERIVIRDGEFVYE